MIKKLIGIIVAVAVVVIIVVAAIRRDNFQSMVRRDELLAYRSFRVLKSL